MPLLTKLTRGRFGAGAFDLPGLSVRTLRIALAPTTSTTPVSTGQRLPPKSIVTGVYVDMRSVASAATPLLDVGINLGGATTGFIAGLSVASTGVRQGSLATGAITLGSLLQETTSGGPVRQDFLTSSASASEVTYSTRAPAVRLEGNIVIEYRVVT